MAKKRQDDSFFDKLNGKRVHLIGIGGSSMSGLALILLSKGCIVSGSDRDEGESLKPLREAGVKVMVGHNPEYVMCADLVVYSMAIPEDHPERAACAKEGIPTMERSVLLGHLSKEFGTSVSICGTHGKTTVTSMLAQILVEADADPTIHIGGVLKSMGGSIRLGESDLFVTEACEYRRSFMNLHPTAAILLNIDSDHLDYYKDINDIEESFGSFLQKLPEDGWIIGNGEDPRVLRELEKLACPVFTYGACESADYRMVDISEDEHGYESFSIEFKGERIGTVKMAVPGLFNAKNATAALAAAHRLGIDMPTACESIGRFPGAHRRFEKTGTLNGAELFHDYGHNPVEMRNAISIARKRCNKGRVWVVIQPHTYSRVKALFKDYLTCTEEADFTLVTDIFGAREQDPGDINSGMLVDGMKEKGIDAVWTPTFQDAAAAIRKDVKAGDLVITLGCGNIYLLNQMLEQ